MNQPNKLGCMNVEGIPEYHIGASITRDRLAKFGRDEIASQFESRYTELL